MTDAGSLRDDEPFSEEMIWEILRDCYDPEIPVNIVDLGLIYGCDITKRGDGSFAVSVQMTLTAPGCGMGEILKDEIERKLLRLNGVGHARVDLVFDPPWDPSRMSEAARLDTGLW